MYPYSGVKVLWCKSSLEYKLFGAKGSGVVAFCCRSRLV